MKDNYLIISLMDKANNTPNLIRLLENFRMGEKYKDPFNGIQTIQRICNLIKVDLNTIFSKELEL